MDESVKLIVVDGDPDGLDREIPVRNSEFVIGRAASCDLTLDHSRVSMQHARLVSVGDDLTVHDLHSTYGTSVNGQNIDSCDLKDGDLLKIGPVTLLVAIGAQPTEARTRTYAAVKALRGKGVFPGTAESRGRDPNEDTPAMATARRIFENIASGRGKEGARPGDDQEVIDDLASALPGGRRQPYLRVKREFQGIQVIELLDRAIIQDSDIVQINRELDAIISQGTNRIILDFGIVRHLSSQALGILLTAQKKCRSAGGALKACNLNTEVAEIFKIANLRRAVEIYPDEDQALLSDWPVVQVEAPPPPSAPAKPAAPKGPSLAAIASLAKPAPVVKLVIDVGKNKGKSIAVAGPQFLIGRDPRCQLRPASEAVSRVHTRIDQREGRVFVRDLGTKNGTLLGKRVLRGEEVEVKNGDPLQIGPLAFHFSITTPAVGAPRMEDAEEVALSVLFQGESVSPGSTLLMPLPAITEEEPTKPSAPLATPRLKTKQVGDFLVASILTPHLDEEEDVAPLRHELLMLLNQNVPNRLILRFDRVMSLSSRAVAMILGHYQRLARQGGGMRICGVPDDILLAVEPLVSSGQIAMYPTAEDAIKEPWASV